MLRKKELLVIFQKISKVINKAFASLGTTIKVTNETTGRQKFFFFLLYELSTKNENVLAFFLPLPIKAK